MGARGGYHRLRTAAAAAAAPSPPGAYRGADSGAAGLAEFGLGDAAQPLGGDASASLLANEYEGTAGFSDGGSGGSYHPRHPGAGNGATPAAAGSGSEEGGAFVLLRNFRLRARDDGWGAVANLDLFFNSIYSYYYHGGLAPIVGSGVVELVSLFFTLWLSVVLFAYVDWRALASCTDEASCQDDLKEYLIDRPFSELTLWNFLVISYCLLFFAYGVGATLGFLATVKEAIESKTFFEDRLGISARKLEGGAVEWDEIVQKIMLLQESGEHRVAIHGQEINALTIAQRILRKENFMVAFFNRGMLDLSVPEPMGWLAKKTFFSKSLEWSIYFTILSYMYNHKYQIRPSFYTDPSSLRRRLILCGVAHAVFMPFLLFFMTLHFSMLNLYDWRSSKQYLGPREWSPVAKWTFREFNELPHAFERRLAPSYQGSEEYIKLFSQNAAITSLGRALVFVSGSLGAVLLAFAAINDAILLHVKLGQWNLLWYVGILGVVYSIGKSLLPESKVHRPSTRNAYAEMDAALAKVATYTHYYPEVWQKRGADRATYSAFSNMFQYKAKLFAMEILSVIFAPIVLCFSLPHCADHICSLVQKVKIDVPGVGDVCGYSVFDFDAFEDESWESNRPAAASVVQSQSDDEASGDVPRRRKRSLEEQMRLDSRPKTRMGKMQKSFFTFKANHPSYKCSRSGQELVDQVESRQHQLAVALAKERTHYIDAAARQLETLRQMDQMRGHDNAMRSTQLDQVNEAYISRRVAAGADSGGGGIDNVEADNNKGENENVDDTVGELPYIAASQNAAPRMPSAGLGTLRSIQSASSIGGMLPNSMLGPPSNVAAASVLHYADTGLSTELQRVLARSTLDPNLSFGGSVLGISPSPSFDQSLASMGPTYSSPIQSTDESPDQNAQRQYLMLERYHRTLEAPQEGTE